MKFHVWPRFISSHMTKSQAMKSIEGKKNQTDKVNHQPDLGSKATISYDSWRPATSNSYPFYGF